MDRGEVVTVILLEGYDCGRKRVVPTLTPKNVRLGRILCLTCLLCSLNGSFSSLVTVSATLF